MPKPAYIAALGIATFALAGHYGIGWMALGTLLVRLAGCSNATTGTLYATTGALTGRR